MAMIFGALEPGIALIVGVTGFLNSYKNLWHEKSSLCDRTHFVWIPEEKFGEGCSIAQEGSIRFQTGRAGKI